MVGITDRRRFVKIEEKKATTRYKADCDINHTVWRSGRLNAHGDELVVARCSNRVISGYFMAGEVEADKTETISWDGYKSYFPRYFWPDEFPEGTVPVVQVDDDCLDYNVKIGKDIIAHKGNYYIKLKKVSHTDPSFTPVDVDYKKNGTAKTKAIQYVRWFNDQNRQLNKHDRLLSQTPKARNRRNKRKNKRISDLRKQIIDVKIKQ